MSLDRITGAAAPALVTLCGLAGACSAVVAWVAGFSLLAIVATYFATAFGLLAVVIWAVVTRPLSSHHAAPLSGDSRQDGRQGGGSI
jgi:hypothetical protein